MKLRVRADFKCYPVWRYEDAGFWLDIDPATLPIPEGLAADLNGWADVYEATFDDAYPPDSVFPDQEAKDRFIATGRELSDRLAVGLGAGAEVEYIPTRLAIAGERPAPAAGETGG